MDRTERFYKICRALEHGASVTKQRFIEDLEVSPATFARDLEYLRSRFNAPIDFDTTTRGYRFNPNAPQFVLPGIWFTASEAESLLTIHKMLHELQPGLLAPHLSPMLERIGNVLIQRNSTLEEVRSRIRIVTIASRKIDANYFELISHAVLERKQLSFNHFNRKRGESAQRHVSPQRLVHYRDNWYLDSFDHNLNALRTFSLDTISELKVIEQKAKNIAVKKLDQELGNGYGIFAGATTQTAVLRFSPFRARWVASEQWHPKQQAEQSADGSYVLRIPYSDDRELLMDILKFGADVEVIAPDTLRQKVQDRLQNALSHYLK